MEANGIKLVKGTKSPLFQMEAKGTKLAKVLSPLHPNWKPMALSK